MTLNSKTPVYSMFFSGCPVLFHDVPRAFVRSCIMPLILALLLPACASDPAGATALGDPAPPLEIKEWLRGEPVTPGDNKHCLLVEFWSTQCPHCVNSIPDLSFLQEVYHKKGLIVLGITSNSAEQVKTFLEEEKNAKDINYRLAIDAQDGLTKNLFMRGFGVQGVPHAFLMDKKGRIIWEGHPRDGMAEAVEQVIAGTYDLTRAMNEDTAEALLDIYVYLNIRTHEKDLITAAGDRMMEKAGDNQRILNQIARTLTTDLRVDTEFSRKTARDAIEKAYALSRGENPVILETYAKILFRDGKMEEATKILMKLKDMVEKRQKQRADQKAEESAEAAEPETPKSPAASGGISPPESASAPAAEE